jgi:RNA polymerase sigma-70 factor (TIGR02943 family)
MNMPEPTLEPTQWINRYADYLFNYTFNRINDRVMAQDLVQETFFAGLKSMPNFKGEASERTWLVSILKRKIIDHYRKSNSAKGNTEVKMSYTSDDASEGNWMEERIADADGNIETVLENEELGLALHHCLGRLPPKQAEIFKMKTMEGRTTEAICNEFAITASNLWVMIHRARTALVRCLKEKWF